MATAEERLTKGERQNKQLVIDRLFAGENRSLSAFPLRAVYMPVESEQGASILISVSKKRFQHAVDRNRVKRQVREAYRKNKGILLEVLQQKSMGLALAFIWVDNKHYASAEVEKRIVNLLQRIAEKLKPCVNY